MRLLRLHRNQQPLSKLGDVIFVSIDFEVSESERVASGGDKVYKPHIKELGIATLDSRHIFTPQDRPSQRKPGIVTRQYSTGNASKDLEVCDVTNFQKCIFAETIRIQQKSIIPTVKRCLQVQDTTPDGITDGTLRSIVLVGHTIKSALKILERRGLDIISLHIIAIIDTHSLSHQILHESPRPSHYTLSGVLARLGCPHNSQDMHNAGNDATYTLYAMLLLAVKWSEQQGLTTQESKNRDLIRSFVHREINEAPRWGSARRALGAHATAEGYLGIPSDTSLIFAA